jgi:hypothetical protein
MSTSSQGGGFVLPGGGKHIEIDDHTLDTSRFPLPPSRPRDLMAHAAHHLALAHHHHKRGHHRLARHHHHMARRHLHHLAKHHKGALAAVMKNSSIVGPGMGEFQPGDPRNPFGVDKGVPKGYLALKKYLETHHVGTEEGEAPGGRQFRALDPDNIGEGYAPEQFSPDKSEPWGYRHKPWRAFPEDRHFQKWSDRPEFPASYKPGGDKRDNAPQGPAGEQQASLSSPLGLSNWQLGQRTNVNVHNKTGSDVFIAASTLTA